MVVTHFDPQTRTGRIVLQPNRSWSWRANLLFLSTLATVSLAIGIGFLIQGYWLILPFNLLELGVVFACLYYCVRATRRQEVLTFSDYDLYIERGRRAPEETLTFKRLFARFLVIPPAHPWYRTRVCVRSHGREVEIGGFLNTADRRELVSALREMVDSLAIPEASRA